MCRSVCMEEARVPYLEKGGCPRGGVWLSRNLKGVGRTSAARASHRLLRGTFPERWGRAGRETSVKPLKRQKSQEGLKESTKSLKNLVDAPGLEPGTR